MSGTKVRVLIVDDSAAMRQLLTHILESDPGIEVVGTAADPYFARDKIIKLSPDVLTLDVEMPRMDGLTFLEKLMQGRPMPVIMVSSLTQAGCDVTMRALELGAVDFFPKPVIDTARGVAAGAEDIISKVKGAAHARVVKPTGGNGTARTQQKTATSATAAFRMTHQVVAIGASTGGTEAIRTVLEGLTPDIPGIVIVQHMPPGFTTSFANRMDSLCAVRVKEAEDGDRVLPGHVLIAPGDYHMALVRSGAEYRVKVYSGPPVNRHRPAVDVLFHSCADHAGKNAIGVILTGMGDDGADGMKAMHDAGAHTIAQDAASCVVYGMPREAVERGGVDTNLPLKDISSTLMRIHAQRAA